MADPPSAFRGERLLGRMSGPATDATDQPKACRLRP